MLSDYLKRLFFATRKIHVKQKPLQRYNFFFEFANKKRFFYVLNHFFYVFEQSFYYFFVSLLRKKSTITLNLYSLAWFLHKERIVYTIYVIYKE